MKKTLMSRVILAFCLIVLGLGIISIDVKAQYHARNNSYDKLHMPTQIIKVDNNYFIVDCLHDQIIYNDWMGSPLKEWGVMASGLNNPHAIASDGELYVVVNTEKHEVIVYEYLSGDFQPIQKFEGIGSRPHYVKYDNLTETFYVWSSFSGEMYLFKRNIDMPGVYLSEIKAIPELYGVYARSFTIDEDSIYIPVVTHFMIYKVNKDTFEIEATYPVMPNIGGMVQIEKIGSYFYITISSDIYANHNNATMLRVQNLESLSIGEYEDLKPYFGFAGVPYYISAIDGAYYVIHENANPGVYRFYIVDDQIVGVNSLY